MEPILNYCIENLTPILISFITGVISSLTGYVLISTITTDKDLLERKKDIMSLKYSIFWSSIENKTFLDNIKIKIKGNRINIKNTNNLEKYIWFASFRLRDNQLIGEWKQKNNNGYRSKGAAYIRLTGEAVKKGLWVGDAEGMKIGYGFWLLACNENEISSDSKKLEKKFTTINLMSDD